MQTPENIHLHLMGQADEATETAIARWRAESAENETAYQDFVMRWRQFDDAVPEADFDMDAGWRDLEARLGLGAAEEQVVVPFPAKRKGYRPMLFAAAAVLIAALGTLFLRDTDLPQVELVSVAGESRQETLPDGSVVWLNGDSRIVFARGFAGKERGVVLQGHAAFQVTKGERPFVVQTAQARVRVLGTRFDVWTGGDKTRVVVDEGRVSVTNAAGKGEVTLNPGGRADISGPDHTPVVSEVTSADFLGWKEGKLLFQAQSLHDIVIDLERTFDRKLVLAQSTLGNKTVTAQFDNVDLDTILAEICLSLGLKYRKEGLTYYISSR
ncbi:MAG: FecR domain-containing protein [Acidobacteriota bacterium]|nr:FecR domain-containing protein [Acidobacteriota bacterium]